MSFHVDVCISGGVYTSVKMCVSGDMCMPMWRDICQSVETSVYIFRDISVFVWLQLHVCEDACKCPWICVPEHVCMVVPTVSVCACVCSIEWCVHACFLDYYSCLSSVFHSSQQLTAPGNPHSHFHKFSTSGTKHTQVRTGQQVNIFEIQKFGKFIENIYMLSKHI